MIVLNLLLVTEEDNKDEGYWSYRGVLKLQGSEVGRRRLWESPITHPDESIALETAFDLLGDKLRELLK